MKTKHYAIGFLGFLGMLGFFVAVVWAVNGLPHVARQFWENAYYLIPVALGFGFQAAMFSWLRDCHKKPDEKVFAAGGGTSAVSMAACCAHHAVDVIPMLGATAGIFGMVTEYRLFFAVLAITSNVLGIFSSLEAAQKAGLHRKEPALAFLKSAPLKRARNALALVFAVLLFLVFLMSSTATDGAPTQLDKSQVDKIILKPAVNEEAEVIVRATPTLEKNRVLFQITLDTHSVELSDDLTLKSKLKDADGNEYTPAAWNGSPPGGHHRLGVLRFDNVKNPQTLQLILYQIAGVDRVFEWRTTRYTSTS